MTSTGMEDFDYESLARYLDGTCDAAERAHVESRIASDPSLRRLLSAVRSASDSETSQIDVQRAWESVHSRMHDTPVLSFDPPRTARPRRWLVPSVALAASVAAVFVGLSTWRSMRQNAGGSEALYATAVGETRDVTLSDGTLVHLAPASQLRVSAGFDRARDVSLDGIARFTVRHDAARPFVVHAGNATVEDVGTIFTVRSDDPDGVAVAVTEGSVRLRGAADSAVVLVRGDRGMVTATGPVVEPGAAAATDTAWTRGGLVFENAPLSRVRSDLRRWYGVTVVTTDSALSTRHLTATFGNDSFDQVLRIIGLALDASVVQRGDTVYIGRP